MFNPFDREDSDLDAAIASAFAHLTTLKADDEGYQTTVEQLTKLYALKEHATALSLQAQTAFAAHQLEADKNAWQEEQDQRPFYKRVDPNTALTVAGNLIVGFAVIKYEQTGVISSKIMSFMQKI